MSHKSELLLQYKERLAAYMAAEVQILKGAQSYSIGNRTLTRADLEAIQKEIRQLNKDIGTLERGGNVRIRRVVFRDQ